VLTRIKAALDPAAIMNPQVMNLQVTTGRRDAP
jgi:hypothetical protein